MSKEVSVKQMGIPQTLSESIEIGKLFFESGLFQDVKSAAQAVVKIQAGAEIGITPFQSISNFHIIKGKPTVGAHLMAARIKASGKYDYEVIKHDDTVCHIDFFSVVKGERGKKIGESVMTIQDAAKLGTQNLQKMPRNMLFARAISNGQRWHCPDVFTGVVYVPEEMNDIPGDQDRAQSDPTTKNTHSIDTLDPNNEEDAKGFEALKQLFHHEDLPEEVEVQGNKYVFAKIWESVASEYETGSLYKVKARQWFSMVKNVISEVQKTK